MKSTIWRPLFQSLKALILLSVSAAAAEPESTRLPDSRNEEKRAVEAAALKKVTAMILPTGKLPDRLPGEAPDARITAWLSKVPFSMALAYTSKLVSRKFEIDDFGTVFMDAQDAPLAELHSKEFKVAPGFFTEPMPVTGRVDARELLVARGIPFPTKTSAFYFPANSSLLVRSTQRNIDLVEILLEAKQEKENAEPVPAAPEADGTSPVVDRL